MAAQRGARDSNFRSNRVVDNIEDKIILLDPNLNEAGLQALTPRLKSKTTQTEYYEWDIDEYLARTDTISAAVSGTTETSIPVTTPNLYIPGDLWMVKRTGEILYVSSVDVSGSRITVVRAFTARNSSGGTAAAAIVEDDVLAKQMNVVGEFSSRRAVVTTTPSLVYNYTQAYDRWVAISRRQMKRKFKNGPSEIAYQLEKTMKELRIDKEATFIDGQRSNQTDPNPDGGKMTTTGGLRQAITSNSLAVGGTLYEDAFDEFWWDNAGRYGSSNKIGIASAQVIRAFKQMAADRVQYQKIGLGTLKGPIGMQVTSFSASDGGMLTLVHSRHMTDVHPGDMLILDGSELFVNYFSGNGISGEMTLYEDKEAPDTSEKAYSISGDFGLGYGHEKKHAIITGVTGGAKGSSLV